MRQDQGKEEKNLEGIKLSREAGNQGRRKGREDNQGKQNSMCWKKKKNGKKIEIEKK